jgi:hypothetical protein
MRDRAKLISEIARYESDVSDAKKEIQKYPWDCEEELYILTKSDVISVFERYLSDSITAEELEKWANFLECREDLGYEKGSEEFIDRVIFLLGNTEINYPITKSLIAELKRGD